MYRDNGAGGCSDASHLNINNCFLVNRSLSSVKSVNFVAMCLPMLSAVSSSESAMVTRQSKDLTQDGDDDGVYTHSTEDRDWN